VLCCVGAPRLSATPAEDNLCDGMDMDDASTLTRASNPPVVSHESDAESWSDTEEDSLWVEVREHARQRQPLVWTDAPPITFRSQYTSADDQDEDEVDGDEDEELKVCDIGGTGRHGSSTATAHRWSR